MELGNLAIVDMSLKHTHTHTHTHPHLPTACPRGVMVKQMDSRIVVSEFKLQSCYYVHFRTNTLGKGMNPASSPNYGLNSTTTVLLVWWF